MWNMWDRGGGLRTLPSEVSEIGGEKENRPAWEQREGGC